MGLLLSDLVPDQTQTQTKVCFLVRQLVYYTDSMKTQSGESSVTTDMYNAGWLRSKDVINSSITISVSLWTGQLATVSAVFSRHMHHTDQTAGGCEGHFGVTEADVSVDMMPLERSQFVVKRASAVRAEQGSTARHGAAGGAEGNFNSKVKPDSS